MGEEMSESKYNFQRDQEECDALGKIAYAFKEYRTCAELEFNRWEYNYGR